MKIYLFCFVFVIIISSWERKEHAINQSWPRHTIDDRHSGADGVRLTDVNNDGLMDITTGWEEGGLTKVYLHPGHESVRKSWPSVVAARTPDVEDAVFSDLDDDGAIDVISSTEGKNRKIYINWAPDNPHYYVDPHAWKSAVLPASDGMTQWMFAVPAQLDGKNGIDFIAGSKGQPGTLGWFESPKNPRELDDWKWHPISDATWIMSIILNDMDADCDVDVVVSDRKPGITNGVRWLENPGAENLFRSTWNNHYIGAQELEVMFMDISDLDGDGMEDVIVCERTHQKIIIWKRLDGSGQNWDKVEIDLPEYVGHAKAVKTGDMDMDGYQDIVLSTNTNQDDSKYGIVWLRFEDNNNFRNISWHQLSGHVGYKFDRLELLDLDGDGDLDVLTCEENYGPDSKGLGVIWYENPYK